MIDSLIDIPSGSLYPKPMELHLTAEQEAQLSRIALHAGKPTEQLITEAALFLFDEQANFREAVQQGVAEANAGNFIEEEEMEARVEKMLRT